MIQVENLSKSFNGVEVLQGVNLAIEKGEVISIIGPSGCGKSTFLRCLNMLEPPTGGRILVDGEEITARGADVCRLRRQMGLVFQSFNLFSHLSILDNLTLGPVKLLGQGRKKAEEKALSLLRLVGIAEKAASFPDELSGGQKQRAAIARCLAMDPKIILFDEPTSALDPTMVSEVLGVVRRLAMEGMTMLIVTHEMEFAEDVSTRVLYFDERGIYEEGPPRQIFQEPRREKTRSFINRIRSCVCPIRSELYDLYAMNGAIEQFCEHHFLSAKTKHNLQLLLEETLSLYPAGQLAEDKAMTLTVSYSEKSGHVVMLFENRGEAFNPLEDAAADEDGLSAGIIRGLAEASFESAATNRLTLVLRSERM